jgi:hypothetical protein
MLACCAFQLLERITYSVTEDGDLVARVHLKLGIDIEWSHCVSMVLMLVCWWIASVIL